MWCLLYGTCCNLRLPAGILLRQYLVLSRPFILGECLRQKTPVRNRCVEIARGRPGQARLTVYGNYTFTGNHQPRHPVPYFSPTRTKAHCGPRRYSACFSTTLGRTLVLACSYPTKTPSSPSPRAKTSTSERGNDTATVQLPMPSSQRPRHAVHVVFSNRNPNALAQRRLPPYPSTAAAAAFSSC